MNSHPRHPLPWYDKTVSVHIAADRLDVSDETIRRYCVKHAIGRQSGRNGPWQVSLAALSMLRSGDTEALEAYRVGDYSNPLVARYFQLRG
jgi:hypothetical protein